MCGLGHEDEFEMTLSYFILLCPIRHQLRDCARGRADASIVAKLRSELTESFETATIKTRPAFWNDLRFPPISISSHKKRKTTTTTTANHHNNKKVFYYEIIQR